MTKIVGFVLSCKDKEETAQFYANLGLETNSHQHGNGPFHFEATSFTENPVVEFYDAETRRQKDTIMLEVDSIDNALAVARLFGIEPTSPLSKYKMAGKNYRYIYITDPDGRDVMLIKEEP